MVNYTNCCMLNNHMNLVKTQTTVLKPPVILATIVNPAIQLVLVMKRGIPVRATRLIQVQLAASLLHQNR